MKENKVDDIQDVELRVQIFARYVQCVCKTYNHIRAS